MVVGLRSASAWRTAFASVIGTSHLKTETQCQDASACQVVNMPDGGEILVCVASDGAGTAPRSQVGAAMAVSAFLDHFTAAAMQDASLALIDRNFTECWLAALRDDLDAMARETGCRMSDFACTVLGAVISPSKARYIQIGDGAIIASCSETGGYEAITWPQHGEFANTTSFITQPDAVEVLVFACGEAPDEVALFTDGIARLVLDFSRHAVHAPALRPIFTWLAGTEVDRSGQASDALCAYLGSELINSRTDDDKTLVMATRVPPVTMVA